MYETKCIVYSNLCHYLNLKFNSRNLFLFTKSARCTNSIYINIRHWIWNSNCCPAPNFCKENNLTVKIINMQVSHYLNLKNMANNYRYQSRVQSNLEVKLKLKLSLAICSKCLTMWIVINKSNFVEDTVIVFKIWKAPCDIFHHMESTLSYFPQYWMHLVIFSTIWKAHFDIFHNMESTLWYFPQNKKHLVIFSTIWKAPCDIFHNMESPLWCFLQYGKHRVIFSTIWRPPCDIFCSMESPLWYFAQ